MKRTRNRISPYRSTCKKMVGNTWPIFPSTTVSASGPQQNTCVQMGVPSKEKGTHNQQRGENTHLTFKGLASRCSDCVGACDRCDSLLELSTITCYILGGGGEQIFVGFQTNISVLHVSRSQALQ
jgi:hypothetical protein